MGVNFVPYAMSKVHRFVTNDLTVRIASVDATAAVQEMQAVQKSFPLASIGVGRAMVGALLMASHLKEKQEVGLLFKGNGPLKSLYAESTFEGHVRGYCPNPQYEAPMAEEALMLGRALGFGTLNVARHQPFQRQPFNGTVQMTSGEVGEDLAHYLHQSHQIRSVVSLGVYLDTYGKVKAAGGLIIEVMPGVEDEVVNLIQKNADQTKINVSEKIFQGATPRDLVEPYVQGMQITQIPHEFEVQYYCPCTLERVKGALTVMGLDELQDMIDKNEEAEVTCQVCGRHYKVSVDEIKLVHESLRKNSMH